MSNMGSVLLITYADNLSKVIPLLKEVDNEVFDIVDSIKVDNNVVSIVWDYINMSSFYLDTIRNTLHDNSILYNMCIIDEYGEDVYNYDQGLPDAGYTRGLDLSDFMEWEEMNIETMINKYSEPKINIKF